jgi:predicted CoA-binding protein
VFWKNEKRLVVDKRPIDVVEAYPFDETLMGKVPEAIVVGENGKLWMQGKIVGSVIVAGESACLELQVKNHSNKKVFLFRSFVFLLLIRF